MQNRKQSRRQRQSQTTIIGGTLMVILIVGVLIGGILAGGGRTVIRHLDPEQRAIYLAEQEALLPGKILGGKVVQLMGVLFVLAITVGVISAGIIGLRYLATQSLTIYPKNGLFPLLRLGTGAFYDANRDNPGINPYITLAALNVQQSAALSSDGAKIAIKMEKPLARAAEDPAMLPGPYAVGALPDLVSLQQLVTAPNLEDLVIGVSENGPVRMSIHELMHVLVVGVTGFGKSAFFRMLISQLARCREPLDVVAIDGSGSEFNALHRWERLLFPVARDTETTILALRAVKSEIDTRKRLYENHPTAHDLKSYNAQSSVPLPPLVVLFDEGTNQLNKRGVGEPLREVVQTARQYGVYLLLAGQSANHRVVNTQTRDNFTTRVCLATSATSRRVVLGESVDAVTKKGRAWVQVPGKPLFQMQIPFITREEMIASLGKGGRPQRQMPVFGAILTDTKSDTHSDTDTADSIRALDAAGVSLRAIQEQIYGYQGGAAYAAVKAALSDTTDTGIVEGL